MSLCYLSERCKKIIKMLLYRCDFVSLQEIAEETGVSRRSVYYDVCNINEWLEEHSVQELEIIRGKGLFIPEELKDTIADLLEEKQTDDYYVFLPSERVKIIICYVLHSKTPVYIEQLIEACQVSRNTVFGDLRVVVKQLHEYDLELKYESKQGYRIEGDAIRARALFFLYFNTLRPLFDSGILTFFNREEIQEYLEKLCELQEELAVDYVAGNLLSLAALLPIMHNNQDKLYFPGLKYEEIDDSKEYKLVQKYFPELEESEKIYLCLHLLGSRISVATDEIFETRENQSVYGITKALVTEFEKTACVQFDNREELERALFVHINTSMYRYRYGIQIGNPLGDDIVREYPNLFEITKIISKYLEQMIGLPIPDSEVAYLALHFGAHLKVSKQKGKKLRILIICVNGVSTGNMIKREVKRLLPEAEIVGVAAAVDVFNVQNICDLVISTVRIKSVLPLIVVRPILTDEDRKNILSHELVRSSQKNKIADTVFEVVKKYVDKENYSALKADIVQCIQGKTAQLDIPVLSPKGGILEYLSEQKILLSNGGMLWQDGVRIAGECLVRNGSIEKRYLETIISQTIYYGTYMFLTDAVMLAHAKPEDGVNRVDVSMTIFKNLVPFGREKAAKIIIVLAAEDHEKHLKILNDIMKITEKEENIERLWQADSAEVVIDELYSVLHK